MDELNVKQLGRATLKSIVALISRNVVLQIIQASAMFIILAVLAPAEIGIYVAVTAIQRVISFFTDFGLGAALVQKKSEITHNDLKTSFTIQAGVTLLILFIVLMTHNQISSYFKLGEQGDRLLIALVATIFISSFKTIPSILLERKVQFQKLVIPQILEALVYNGLLIILILQGFKIDSYTVAFLASSLISLPLYYYLSPWKMAIGIDRASLNHLKFGAQFQAKNILATIKDDLLTVILTKFLTFTEIGYIGSAQRIAFLAYRHIVDSVTKVTFSTFARIQENNDVLKKAIEKSLFFVASLMFPVLLGIIMTVPYFIQFIPEQKVKWEPAILSLIFFCLNAAVSSLSGILVNVLDATGRVKTTLNLMVIWTILTWILTPLFIRWYGYNGVAIASFMVTLTVIYTVYLVNQKIQFDFLKSIYKPFLCTLVMGIIVFAGTKLFVTDLLSLAVVIIVGGLSYIVSFYLVSKKELFEIRSFLFKKYAK